LDRNGALISQGAFHLHVDDGAIRQEIGTVDFFVDLCVDQLCHVRQFEVRVEVLQPGGHRLHYGWVA
jgi:hypothetical protein